MADAAFLIFNVGVVKTRVIEFGAKVLGLPIAEGVGGAILLFVAIGASVPVIGGIAGPFGFPVVDD